MPLKMKKFSDIDISDTFFDSLKEDYAEFNQWFSKKGNEDAYVFYDNQKLILGFLYLKIETGEVSDVVPPLPRKKRLKIGTFKIIPHGTRLGEHFMKKVFDNAVELSVEEIYVTIFECHHALIDLLSRYGFKRKAKKNSSNGEELVLVKKLSVVNNDPVADYPLIDLKNANAYLLSIYPKWHTKLFPDSILKTEARTILQDVSHTNSIHKVYLAAMDGMQSLKRGDVLVIYRTSDGLGPALYRSVATSFCVLEEYRGLASFQNISEFMKYCEPYSIFTDEELKTLWRSKKYRHVIRFTYNIAFNRRPNREEIINNIGMTGEEYFGFLPLKTTAIKRLARMGGVDESFIVD